MAIISNYKFTDVFGNETIAHGYNGKPETSPEFPSIEELPLQEQDLILEEAFVAFIQGPLGKKYNNFFGVNEENIRRKKVTKWWNPIAVHVEENLDELDQAELMRKLNDGEPLSEPNMRDYIVNRFNEQVKPISSNELGFEARVEEANAKESVKHVDAMKDLAEEDADTTPIEDISTDRNNPLNETITELTDDDILTGDISNLTQRTFQLNAAKATKLLDAFIKAFNKAARTRTLYGMKTPMFDRDNFKAKILMLAKNAKSSPEFIKALNETTEPDLIAFKKFMDISFPANKNSILRSMSVIMGNWELVQGAVSTIVNTNGKIRHQINLGQSVREKGSVQNAMDFLKRANKLRYDNNSTHPISDQYENFEKVIDRIANRRADEKDFVTALRFISQGAHIQTGKILAEGSLTIGGRQWDPFTVIDAFVRAGKHKGDDGNMYVYKFKPIIEAMVEANRPYSAASLMQNAENNSVPIRITNNFLTKELNQMEQDLVPDRTGRVMPKEKFVKKYSHITNRHNYKNTSGNLFLESYYDSVVNSKGTPKLTYYGGLDDRVTTKGTTYDKSNAFEQSYEDFMFFLRDTSNPKQTMYRQNAGTLGDSPRKFYIPTKRIRNKGIVSNGKFNPNSPEIRSSYNIYRNTVKKPMTYNGFIQEMNNQLAEEKKMFADNRKSLSKIESMKPLFNDKGLSAKGIDTITDYFINRSINGAYINEVFSPNISGVDIDKRMKNSASQVYSVNDKLKVIPLVVKDMTYENDPKAETTDGGMYILEKHAKIWAKSTAGLMDLNNGF